MGIIAWIAVAMAAALLATTVLPGNRSQGLFFSSLTCFTGTTVVTALRRAVTTARSES